jgi:hypothetical protein
MLNINLCVSVPRLQFFKQESRLRSALAPTANPNLGLAQTFPKVQKFNQK